MYVRRSNRRQRDVGKANVLSIRKNSLPCATEEEITSDAVRAVIEASVSTGKVTSFVGVQAAGERKKHQRRKADYCGDS